LGNRPQIIFRADGNSNIGLGHVIRSLAIADMIKDEFDCVFAIKSPTDQLQKIILESCNKIINLREEDAEDEFISFISSDAIVVLDGYLFKTDMQIAIKNKGCKLVCIDDLNEWHFVADAIINQNSDITTADYSKEPYTRLFSGLDYAMLRKPFLDAAKKERYPRKIKNIIINFGGADMYNLTLKVLRACIGIGAQINIHIITGAAYRHLDTLNEFKGQKSIFFHDRLNADQMCSLMLECELIICPASSVCIEALSAGMNIITGYYADNQRAFASFLNREQYASSIGDFLEITIQQLSATVANAIKIDDVSVKKKVIDGKQDIRFINLFKSL